MRYSRELEVQVSIPGSYSFFFSWRSNDTSSKQYIYIFIPLSLVKLENSLPFWRNFHKQKINPSSGYFPILLVMYCRTTFNDASAWLVKFFIYRWLKSWIDFSRNVEYIVDVHIYTSNFNQINSNNVHSM